MQSPEFGENENSEFFDPDMIELVQQFMPDATEPEVASQVQALDEMVDRFFVAPHYEAYLSVRLPAERLAYALDGYQVGGHEARYQQWHEDNTAFLVSRVWPVFDAHLALAEVWNEGGRFRDFSPAMSEEHDRCLIYSGLATIAGVWGDIRIDPFRDYSADTRIDREQMRELSDSLKLANGDISALPEQARNKLFGLLLYYFDIVDHGDDDLPEPLRYLKFGCAQIFMPEGFPEGLED